MTQNASYKRKIIRLLQQQCDLLTEKVRQLRTGLQAIKQTKLSSIFQYILLFFHMDRVHILGHFFVSRFKSFLIKGSHVKPVPTFNLSSVILHFLGIGGRTVTKILALNLGHVRAFQPKTWFH